MHDTVSTRLDELRESGQRLIDAGNLAGALRCCEDALDLANRSGLPEQVDLAICNRAAVLIAQRRGTAEIPKLREILLRSSEATNCRLASYNIALHYEYVGETKKALFYARIALERSQQLDRSEWIASSLNQVGNALLADSHIAKATETYERAIQLMPLGEAVARCRILNNLGYCRLLQHRHKEGLGLLYQALRVLRRLGNQTCQTMVHLDLSFGLLEIGKLAAARRHGLEALRLAELGGEEENQKNALYLLGEAANLSGNEPEASDFFEHLQRRFFPDSPYLPGFLLSIDIRNLVNLHA